MRDRLRTLSVTARAWPLLPVLLALAACKSGSGGGGGGGAGY
jgi:hypothetical protein